MNKVKMRCSVCGKSFKSPSLKKTICPSCEAAAKRAKHQQSVEPSVAAAPLSASSVDVRAALRAAQDNQGQFGAYRPPAPPPPTPTTDKPAAHGHRAAPHGHAGKPDRPDHRGAAKQRDGKEARPPKQPRVPKLRIQTKPFEPTPEQTDTIRRRYFELAQPEFNGIRHQIATELGIPLRAVKQVIKVAREENQIQSWWEQGGGLPSAADLERIKELYIPLLPEPEVGVHKIIASALHITNTSVYHAIGQIRTDLHLPRYTPRENDANVETDDSEVATHDEQPLVPVASGE